MLERAVSQRIHGSKGLQNCILHGMHMTEKSNRGASWVRYLPGDARTGCRRIMPASPYLIAPHIVYGPPPEEKPNNLATVREVIRDSVNMWASV